jgi:hypothetical protein
MRDIAGDFADTNYVLVPDGADGLAELSRTGRAFGVVCDSNGDPVRLVTKIGHAPLAQIDAGVRMRRLMARDIASLFDAGVPGLVVVRDSRVVGVITAKIVSDYRAEHPPVVFGMMGDEQLHGNAPASWLILSCASCGTSNTITFFVSGQTQCSQGHPLMIAGE